MQLDIGVIKCQKFREIEFSVICVLQLIPLKIMSDQCKKFNQSFEFIFRIYVKSKGFQSQLLRKSDYKFSEQELKGGHVLYIVQTIHTVHEF